MKNIKKDIAEFITKAALETAKNTVGRSFPQGIHEVEVPEAVKKYVRGK